MSEVKEKEKRQEKPLGITKVDQDAQKEQKKGPKRARDSVDDESTGIARKDKEEEIQDGDANLKSAAKKIKFDETSKENEMITQENEKKAESLDSEVDAEPKKVEAETKELENADQKPKFVFGSASSFGSGFKAAKTTNESGNINKEKGESDKSPKPFSFGSGLSFVSGFGVLKKAEDKTDESDEKEKKEPPNSEQKQEKNSGLDGAIAVPVDHNTVKLQKQEIKSGEESEETIYQVNAKLYQLSDLKDGWKERGVGTIRVNKNMNTQKVRLVMRSRGILKVILNLPLVKGFNIQRGFPGSLQSEKFIRMITVDDNKAPVQYAVKTGKEDTIQELYESIVKQVPN